MAYASTYLLANRYSWNPLDPNGLPQVAPVSLTYTFLQSLPSYYASAALPAARLERYQNSFQAFDTAQASATLDVLGAFSNVGQITFAETSQSTESVGGLFQRNLAFGRWFPPLSLDPNGIPEAGHAYFPRMNVPQTMWGDVWISRADTDNTNPQRGGPGFSTLLHEVGHAVGLEHSATTGVPITEDSELYTVMSENPDQNGHQIKPGAHAVTPMLYDVAAIQRLYGANTAYRSQNDTYVFANTASPYGNPAPDTVLMTIWDGGGRDIIDASLITGQGVLIDLRPGEFSAIGVDRTLYRNIAIAYGATIEDAYAGPDSAIIYGNAVDNLLKGGIGNDSLVGGGGNDTLIGGLGRDVYVRRPGAGHDHRRRRTRHPAAGVRPAHFGAFREERQPICLVGRFYDRRDYEFATDDLSGCRRNGGGRWFR